MAEQCADAERFELFSPSKVCDFVKEQVPGVSEDVLEKVMDHKIDDEVFLELNDTYLKEIAPLLGDRLKIRRAITTARAGRSTVSLIHPILHLRNPLCCCIAHLGDKFAILPSHNI